jgi:hypothetical protein
MESALTNRPISGSRYAARVVIVQPETRLFALPCELEIGGRRAALPTNTTTGEVARAVVGRACGERRAAEMVTMNVCYTHCVAHGNSLAAETKAPKGLGNPAGLNR